MAAHGAVVDVGAGRAGICCGNPGSDSAVAREVMDMTEALEIAGSRTELRIGWLTIVFGAAATAVAAVFGHRAWASGLAVGTVLGWLNFRWLGRVLDALVLAATAQHGAGKPVVPWWNYV